MIDQLANLLAILYITILIPISFNILATSFGLNIYWEARSI